MNLALRSKKKKKTLTELGLRDLGVPNSDASRMRCREFRYTAFREDLAPSFSTFKQYLRNGDGV